MIEIVDTVHSVLAYSDVIKHQTVHQALLHPPDDLLLAEDAGGDHGDVLEGWFDLLKGNDVQGRINISVQYISKDNMAEKRPSCSWWCDCQQ